VVIKTKCDKIKDYDLSVSIDEGYVLIQIHENFTSKGNRKIAKLLSEYTFSTR